MLLDRIPVEEDVSTVLDYLATVLAFAIGSSGLNVFALTLVPHGPCVNMLVYFLFFWSKFVYDVFGCVDVNFIAGAAESSFEFDGFISVSGSSVHAYILEVLPRNVPEVNVGFTWTRKDGLFVDFAIAGLELLHEKGHGPIVFLLIWFFGAGDLLCVGLPE